MKHFRSFLRSAFLTATLTLNTSAVQQPVPEKNQPTPERKEVAVQKQPTAPRDENFATWLEGVRKEARKKGISEKTILAALPETLRPIQKVIDLDRSQPEKKTLREYLEKRFTDYLINLARTEYAAHQPALDSVHVTYPSVPKELVVALWANETNCGHLNPKYLYDVIPALATLAYDTRRPELFRAELFSALSMVDNGHVSVNDFKGSYAGATGQVQFMPTSFEKRAVDFNGDGKKDLWHSYSDIFASAANYMQKAGWNPKETWGYPVTLAKPLGKDILGVKVAQPLEFWEKKGVRLMDGSSVPAKGASSTASIIQPDGPGTQAYIVFDNFKDILKWNNSTYFATSVSLMYDAVRKTMPPPKP